MKNSKNKKIIFLSIISFLTIALSLLIKSNITYGNEENAYNFDDLKVGDYLPFGATVQLDEDHYTKTFFKSGGAANSYGNSATIIYLPKNIKNKVEPTIRMCSLRNYYCTIYDDTIEYKYTYENFSSNTIKIKSVSNIYEKLDYGDTSDSPYTGWLISEIFDNYIVLVPTQEYSKVNVTPSINNLYTIDTTFINTSDNQIDNQWYLVKDINNYEVSDSSFWKNDSNVLHFLYKGTSQVGDTYTLTYTFEASVGDILTFDTKSWAGASWYSIEDNIENIDYNNIIYDTYEIKFNDTILPYPTGCTVSNYYCDHQTKCITVNQNNSLYETVNLEVSKSGKQTLSFTYKVNGNTSSAETLEHLTYGRKRSHTTMSYNYGYVKGVALLTPINEGATLDTSKVKDGDEVLYRSTSQTTGYVLSERLTYTDGHTASEEENPKTSKFIPFITLILLLISIIALIKYYQKKKYINEV